MFIFGVVIIASLAGQRLGQQIQTDAKLLINHIDAADAEREKLLSSLNAYNYTQCNDSTLLAMRRALFDATYVVDIGFFKTISWSVLQAMAYSQIHLMIELLITLNVMECELGSLQNFL